MLRWILVSFGSHGHYPVRKRVAIPWAFDEDVSAAFQPLHKGHLGAEITPECILRTLRPSYTSPDAVSDFRNQLTALPGLAEGRDMLVRKFGVRLPADPRVLRRPAHHPAPRPQSLYRRRRAVFILYIHQIHQISFLVAAPTVAARVEDTGVDTVIYTSQMVSSL